MLLLTAPWLSPITEVARHVLVCDIEGPSPYYSFALAIALIETLILAVVGELGELGELGVPARQRVESLEKTRLEIGMDLSE